MNVWIKLMLWLGIVFMAWQFGRGYGYQEGHNDTIQAIGRSTITTQELLDAYQQ